MLSLSPSHTAVCTSFSHFVCVYVWERDTVCVCVCECVCVCMYLCVRERQCVWMFASFSACFHVSNDKLSLLPQVKENFSTHTSESNAIHSFTTPLSLSLHPLSTFSFVNSPFSEPWILWLFFLSVSHAWVCFFICYSKIPNVTRFSWHSYYYFSYFHFCLQ